MTLRKIALSLVAAWTLCGLWAPRCQAQLQKPPELILRLWPFFRSTRPVPQLPEPTDESAPADKAEPDLAKAKATKPLIAPFVPMKIDVNRCTLEQLQNLPGVGPSMGAHIMAGRPYDDYEDLQRDGVPLNVVQGLKGKITFGP